MKAFHFSDLLSRAPLSGNCDQWSSISGSLPSSPASRGRGGVTIAVGGVFCNLCGGVLDHCDGGRGTCTGEEPEAAQAAQQAIGPFGS